MVRTSALLADHSLAAKAGVAGADVFDAIGLLLMWYHDLLWMKHRLPHDGVVHLDRLSQLEAEAASISVDEIRRRAQILEEMAESVEQRVNPVLALQVALSRVANGSEAGDPVYF